MRRKARKQFKCKICGKQYCFTTWAVKHNIKFHDNKAGFEWIAKLRGIDDARYETDELNCT